MNSPCLCIGYVFFGNWSINGKKGNKVMKISFSWIQLWNMSYSDCNASMPNEWFLWWWKQFLIPKPRNLEFLSSI